MRNVLIPVLILAVILGGLYLYDRQPPKGTIEVSTPEKYGSYSHIGLLCIDGVEYLKDGDYDYFKVNWVTPHFKPDGTLHTCEEGK